MNRNSKTVAVICFVIVSCIACIAARTKAGKRISAGERVMLILSEIESTLKETRYQHVTRVSKRRGEYFFDCSGMAAWVLKRAAPAALKAVGRPNDKRPAAVHFYRKIAKIKPGRKKGPWYRVPTAAQILPGDLIAWKRPPWFRSTSTGHVAFAVGLPKNNPGEILGILVRVADASKFKHEDDSRASGTTGYGTGVLLLPTDKSGNPLGYGWVGSQTQKEWLVPAELVIGRPLR